MFAQDRGVFLSLRAATVHNIRMRLKELVEPEDRPDPAPTSSRKSKTRNRALSKPDNECFQLNPPRLIISYMLEHYPAFKTSHQHGKCMIPVAGEAACRGR